MSEGGEGRRGGGWVSGVQEGGGALLKKNRLKEGVPAGRTGLGRGAEASEPRTR